MLRVYRSLAKDARNKGDVTNTGGWGLPCNLKNLHPTCQPVSPVMQNMFGGRSKGRRHGHVDKVSPRGLFDDGIWKCNCDPRLPADRFQTKNGGKNHGRWCKRDLIPPQDDTDDSSLHLSTDTAQTLRLLPLGRRGQTSRGQGCPEQLTDRTTYAHEESGV